MAEKHITPPGVMIYSALYDGLLALSNEQLGIIIRAMMDYVRTGTVPQLEDGLNLAWNFVKGYVDNDTARYRQIVERNRAASTRRWKNEKVAESLPPARPNKYSTPTAKAHDGADWMAKYTNPAENQNF